jgi:exopolysaccharide biosynthesis WecB/TagA/CpsF family protein
MRVGRQIEFLGLRFDCSSIDEALADIAAQAPDCRFRYVLTPNVQNVVQLSEDRAALDPVFARAWRVLCDSRVLALLARLTGQQLPVVPGSDLTPRLVEHADRHGLTIAVIGSSAADCARLAERFPRLRIARHTPPMGFIGNDAEVAKCVDFVVATRAPLVFLAVGMPRQAVLAARIADHPQAVGVGLCIGASIDFLTGRQSRAPLWMQRLCLEWLYRLLRDPARMAHRYLVECPRIFHLMLAARSRQ